MENEVVYCMCSVCLAFIWWVVFFYRIEYILQYCLTKNKYILNEMICIYVKIQHIVKHYGLYSFISVFLGWGSWGVVFWLIYFFLTITVTVFAYLF